MTNQLLNNQRMLSADNMVREMEALKPVVLNNYRILAPYNRRDDYFRQIFELANQEYFFETYLVIVWAAMRLKPRRIMEIGTRNGGSIVQLLSMIQNYEGLEVVCFDMWREIGSPRKVKKNLSRMNIPVGFIQFISGDSTKTVPSYFSKCPDKQFDYILVDGGHERDVAIADLRNVADRIAPGGIVIFDDIGPESYKLDDVWQQWKSEQGPRFQYFEKYWRKGVAWAIRPNGDDHS